MSVKLHLLFRKDGSAPALIAALLYVTLEDGWVYDHIVVIFQAGILYRHCERLDVGRCTEAADNNVPSLITVTPLRIETELSEPTSFTKSQLLLSLTMLADSVLSGGESSRRHCGQSSPSIWLITLSAPNTRSR